MCFLLAPTPRASDDTAAAAAAYLELELCFRWYCSCLNNVILAKGPLIRSGWKTVLRVLRSAAKDTEEEVCFVFVAC